MKRLFVALALTIAAATVAPASADVGISIRVGEPRISHPDESAIDP